LILGAGKGLIIGIMPDIKTTEREFAIKLIGWLNQFNLRKDK